MAAPEHVDIRGVDKVQLLLGMARETLPPEQRGWLTDKGFDKRELQRLVQGPVAYFRSRPIHANLAGDAVDSSNYNRVVGQGALQRVVETLK